MRLTKALSTKSLYNISLGRGLRASWLSEGWSLRCRLPTAIRRSADGVAAGAWGGGATAALVVRALLCLGLVLLLLLLLLQLFLMLLQFGVFAFAPAVGVLRLLLLCGLRWWWGWWWLLLRLLLLLLLCCCCCCCCVRLRFRLQRCCCRWGGAGRQPRCEAGRRRVLMTAGQMGLLLAVAAPSLLVPSPWPSLLLLLPPPPSGGGGTHCRR